MKFCSFSRCQDFNLSEKLVVGKVAWKNCSAEKGTLINIFTRQIKEGQILMNVVCDQNLIINPTLNITDAICMLLDFH